jgi:hypothetical protein
MSIVYNGLQKKARCSVVGCGAVLQVGRSQVRISVESLDFPNLHNLSSHPMALWLTQFQPEMSTRQLPGG